MTHNTINRIEDAGATLEEQLRTIGWVVSQQALRALPEGTVIVSTSTGVLERFEGDVWLCMGSIKRLASHEICLPCQVLQPAQRMTVVGIGAA